MRRTLPIPSPSRGLALLAACATLAGCAGAPTRFYTLEPQGGAAPASAYSGAPVRVEAVHIPEQLNRLELVAPSGPNAVQVRDLAHWAAPLGELSRRALTQDLMARLPQGAVVFPDAPKPTGAAGLVIDVLALSPGPDATVMDVSWTLLPAARGGAPHVHQARLSTVAQAGAAGQAAELSALLSALADRIAADLTAAPP